MNIKVTIREKNTFDRNNQSNRLSRAQPKYYILTVPLTAITWNKKITFPKNSPLGRVGAVGSCEDVSFGDEAAAAVPDYLAAADEADGGHVREFLGLGLSAADDEFLVLDGAERGVDQLLVTSSQDRRRHQRVHRLRVLGAHCGSKAIAFLD